MGKYKKTVSAMVIYFNDYFWLDSCIRNIYNYVDQIVIVEGVVELLMRIGAKFDGSGSKIVKGILDPDNKILFFKEKIFDDKLKQRQFALDQCTGDWIFIVDADEFYKKNHLRKLRLSIDSASPACDMILFPHFNFFDFEHYNKKNYMERVFKNDKKNIGYWGDPKDGQNIYRKDIGKIWDKINFERSAQSRFLFCNNIRCHHYSKMKDWDSILLRVKYYLLRSDRSLAGERLDDVAYKWVREHMVCVSTDNMGTYLLEDHPEIIKEHYLYKKYKDMKYAGRENDFIFSVMYDDAKF